MKQIKPIAWLRLYTIVAALFCTLLMIEISAEPISLSPGNLTPSQVVKTAISDVLNDMRNNESLLQKEPVKLDELARQKVAPYFDFPRMTQLAMTTYWNSATEPQKLAAADAFQSLFIATYGKQLFNYRNINAEVEALPGATEQKANLKLKVTSQSGENITLVLRVEKRVNTWKIIDVNADGVSYVVTMRGQFSEILSGKGVDGLIKFLKESAQQKAS